MRKWIRIVFLLYGVWMLWLLFGQRMGQPAPESYIQALRENLNLIPFATVKRFVYVLQHMSAPWLRRQAVINLLGNVGMFIPLGFCIPGAFPKIGKLWQTVLVSFGILLTVESLQLFTLLGSGDVDDLILNTVGVLLGFGLWKLTACFRRPTGQ